MKKTDTMLYRMVKNSKGQFFAVFMIVFIGICVFVAMNMTARNMRDTVNEYYRDYGFADLFIELDAIPEQKIAELEQWPQIAIAEGRIVIDATLNTDDPESRVNLTLISQKDGQKLLLPFPLSGAKQVKEAGDALVLNQFAAARAIQIGDKLQIRTGGLLYNLKATGIGASSEFIYLMESAQSMLPDPQDYGVLFISQALARTMAGADNQIAISYSDASFDEEELISDLKERLAPYGVTNIIKAKDQLSNSIITQELDSLDTVSQYVPLLFLTVAALVLIMLLARLVKNDRVKIGILKAVGYTNGEVFLHYIKYALAVGFAGGLTGAVAGTALAGAMTRMYLQYFNIPMIVVSYYPAVIGGAVLFSCIMCGAAGLIGARGVLSVTPAKAMQSEAPKVGKRIFLQKLPWLWQGLPFSGKLVCKNLFRNKKRTAFVLFGVAVTFGMMLFSSCMPGAIDQMVLKFYSEFQKMNYNISFKTPIKAAAANDLKHIIDIDYMEGRVEFPFELESGHKKETANIIGIAENSRVYSFKDTDGKPLALPDDGLLLSTNLAKLLNVKQGDIIKVKSYLQGRPDRYLRIEGLVQQALGINAYMNIQQMGEQLWEKNVINGVYILTADDEVNSKLRPLRNIASVQSVRETMAMYEQYMQMTYISIFVMLIFSGILGFCIVYNSTVIAIGERQTEFSALLILGFSRREILKMILQENNIITICGIIVGIPLGMLMLSYTQAAFTTKIYTIALNPGPLAFLAATIFTVLCVVGAELMTYKKINKLDFLDALKNRTN